MFVIAGVGLIAAVASVAAFLGSWWWPLDLLANFRPQLGVSLLILGVFLVLGRWRRTARIVLLAALVNLGLVAWLWVPQGGGNEPGGERLRVVTFNVLAANESYDEVMAFLAQADADVVFLHESSRPWEEAAEEAGLGYEVVRTRDDDHIFGTLVLVRGSATVEGFGFTEREPRAVEVLLETEGGAEVALLGVHPLAPVTQNDAALRDAQVAFAARWAADQNRPHVVAGDFNAGPWSHAFRRLLDRGGLRDSQRGFGLQTSFPVSSMPIFRISIDHVVVSEEIAVVDRRLGPSLGSDHFPVIVDVEIG